MKPLIIHFLNVGHGDCTIIEFPSGRLTVVDINNSQLLDKDTEEELYARKGYRLFAGHDSIQEYRERLIDPIDFFLQRYGRTPIFRYIQTHPDMDHMTGLCRLVHQEKIKIVNFWDTQHAIMKESQAAKWANTKYDPRDWEVYQALRQGKLCKVITAKLNDQKDYWKDDGIHLWAPTEHRPDEEDDVNVLSYVLRIKYGECTILLGGDAPTSYWEWLVRVGFKNRPLPKINLLKAPHHGRKSGWYMPAIRAMSPSYTIMSTGKLLKKDDALAQYEQYSECFTTREHGSISAYCYENGAVLLDAEDGTHLNY